MKVLIITLFLFAALSISAQNDKASYKKLDKALKLIESQYVDTIDAEKLATAAVQAMIKELDPHSKYLSAETLKSNNETLNGSFAGVGIHYQILNDTMIVLNVVPGGPAQMAGIIAGDKLLEVDGISTVGKELSNSFLSAKLRGPKGTKPNLKVLRHADKSIQTIEITRDNISINTLSVNYMISKTTGFIRITNFSRNTNLEFQMAVMQLQSEGMKNLIVDLRGNPGGLMIASINMADAFLEDGKLIVYTEGAHSARTEYKATAGGALEKGKVVVLIDGNSASASEIFAGAIQDWDRGIIMGRRSFGKGLVGRNYTLPDGSAIRITTGRYYTPSGRCIQKSYQEGNEKYKQDRYRRFENGEIYNADSIHFDDSLKYYTDGKRLVYGGGAIMPDIFIPMDTSFNSPYLNLINRYGFINYYTGIYFDKNLEMLQNQFPTFRQFNAGFIMTDEMFDDMNALAFDKHKIKGSSEDILISKEVIKTSFKAYLARNLYENGSYYQVTNQIDQMVVQALETINRNKLFKAKGIHE